MQAADDSSTDRTAPGGTEAPALSWISDQAQFVGGSTFAGPDSSTDFMGTDSAVDPDHNPLDLEAKEHQLNTEKDAAACQGQGEGIMQRPPIEGGAADGDNKDTASAKDTGQGTEEAAAEPSVIDESKVDEVRLGLVSVESPDGQRAWLGRNPRKAIQRPHLAGLPTGAQMPAIQRKALESRPTPDQTTTPLTLPPIQKSNSERRHAKEGPNSGNTSTLPTETRAVSFAGKEREVFPADTKVYRLPKCGASQKGKAEVHFIRSGPPMPKKPPPAIPGLDDLPKVPIPKGFDRARFVRVKPDNKASLNRKKRDKSPAPKAGAQPQGSPPQPQQHPPEQHPHPPQSSQPQPTQQPQQTPSVEVPPTTESTPEPSLQQPRPEQTKLEVAPSAQPLKKTPSIRICGVKVKEASAMYAPLSLKSDQQKAEKNKKTLTPEARAEAYIRERFFVKRKPPNFDVVFTRSLNPPFNTTTDPEQHKTFVSMYGKMPIY